MSEATVIKGQNIKNLNTFGMNINASHLVHFTTKEEIKSFLNQQTLFPRPFLAIGSGSNLLFTKDFEGTLLHSELNYIETVYEDDDIEKILVGSGVIWDDFVMHCVNEGLYGVENLRSIPGTIGAAPVQNIGAYGAEVKDVIQQVVAYHIESGEMHIFSNEDCQFSYRNSIFKNAFRNQYLIAEVLFELRKDAPVNASYGSIEECLKSKNLKHIGPKDISECVKEIRDSKLPDPDEYGNAGSFFKNPIISWQQLKEIKTSYPDVPVYNVDDECVKVAAGWMIDQRGWKGKQVGGAAVHDKQALVLINKDNATPSDVIRLAEMIVEDIRESFGIVLEPEVNYI